MNRGIKCFVYLFIYIVKKNVDLYKLILGEKMGEMSGI